MLYIISQIAGWIATFFRAGGMLAKKPMTVKLLVSVGNLGWMLSGICTGNVPLSALVRAQRRRRDRAPCVRRQPDRRGTADHE